MTATSRRQLRWRRFRKQGNGRTRRGWVLAIALLGAWSGLAMAQEGPVVIGGKTERKFRFLDLERPEVILGMEAQYSSNKVKQRVGESSDATTLVFQEQVELKTKGYLVSPQFFDMGLYGLFGLDQSQASGSGVANLQTGDDNGHIYAYDVLGTLRKDSSLPVTAYARRTEQLVSRTFGSTLKSIFNSYGVDVTYQSATLPTMFRLFHEDNSQAALTGEQDYSTDLNAFEWQTEWRPSKRQTLSWNYRYNQYGQSEGGAPSDSLAANMSYDTQEANLVHKIQFGDKGDSDLTSSLNYLDQTGDLTQERIQLDERLHWQHSKSFETNYYYRYFDYTFGDNEQVQHEARVNFIHQLFQSLTTTGNAGVRSLEFGSGAGQSDEQFMDLGTVYTKHVPLGVMSLHARGAWSRQQNAAQQEPVQIVDEPHVFQNFQPVILARQYINPKSIRVTSSNGLFTYRENVDYTLRAFGDRVEIWPTPGGLLGPVASTLIDYELDPQPANDTDTNVFSFGGRYTFTEGMFKGLGVYASYLMQDQTVSAADPSRFTPDDIRDLLYGVDYRIWKLMLSAEYRDHDSTVSPFAETRFIAQFLHRTTGGTSLSLDARYQMYDYSGGTGDQVDILTLSGTLDHYFTRSLRGSFKASYLQQESSLRDSLTGTDLEMTLEWKHRQTEIYGTIRHSTLTTDETDSSFLFFQMGIKRSF